MSETITPDTNIGAVAEGFRLLLIQNIGNHVVVELWLGGGILQRRCGLLTSVGEDYFLLADEVNNQQIAGELSSIRLVTFCRTLPMPIADGEAAEQSPVAPEQTTPEPTTPEPSPAEQFSAVQARARPHAQAAFNYAKRKTRRLD